MNYRRYLVPTIIAVIAIIATGIFLLLVPSGIIPSKVALILEALSAILAIAMIIVILRIGMQEAKKAKALAVQPPVEDPRIEGKKKWVIALLWLFIPFILGLGHLYIGSWRRGIIFMFTGFIALALAMIYSHNTVVYLSTGIVFISLYWYQLFDVMKIARQMGMP